MIQSYLCFISSVVSYPDFGDGLLQAFAVSLPESDGVKLALVQVRHCPITCLLTQGFGCLERVLEIISERHRNK